MEQLSDFELITAYRGGDDKALSALIRRYLTPIYRFAYRMVGEVQAAEDITQEVFLKAWRHLQRFDAAKSFKTWLFAIARNTAIDQLRKKEPLTFAALENDGLPDIGATIPDTQLLASELMERDETEHILEAALEDIQPNARAVVLMHDLEDMTFEEIAAAVNEPMNTVKSRYRRAIAVLREKINLHQNR